MVHQAVEQRRDDDDVAEEFRPVIDGSVGGDDGGELFVAAHQHVGKLVARCEKDDHELRDLSLEAFRAVCGQIDGDVFDCLGADNVVKRYQSEGNAGPESAARQITFWREELARGL